MKVRHDLPAGFWAFLVAWLTALSLTVTWLATDVERYIRVADIHIFDGSAGQPVRMEVARIIHQDFEGSYRVIIRYARTGGTVCDTGRVDISYRRTNEDGTLRTLSDPLWLKWWAYGGDCFQGDISTHAGTGALAQGLAPGLYAQETCHAVRRFWGLMPPAWVCWPITTFRILPDDYIEAE